MKLQGVIFDLDGVITDTAHLHFHDINKLLAAFNALIERGHTIVIVEHNMDEYTKSSKSSTSFNNKGISGSPPFFLISKTW